MTKLLLDSSKHMRLRCLAQ